MEQHIGRNLPASAAKSTAEKVKLTIKDFFSNCDQIRWKQRLWSHLLRKSLLENFIFCAVKAIVTKIYWAPYLEPCQTSIIERFCENS